ncbi:MAG: hypothetical protein HQL51_16165, partial [Magnetococcales bacterium]|nr:hypothetical protein [Magnetococcales bacterium]
MTPLWTRFLEAAKAQFSPGVYDTWIKPLRPTGSPDHAPFTLLAPNGFAADWINKQYAAQLAELLEAAAGAPVHFVVLADPSPPIPQFAAPALLPLRL